MITGIKPGHTRPSGEVDVLTEARRAMTKPQRRASLEHQTFEKPALLQREENVVVEEFLLDDQLHAVQPGIFHGSVNKVCKKILHHVGVALAAASACSSRMSS